MAKKRKILGLLNLSQSTSIYKNDTSRNSRNSFNLPDVRQLSPQSIHSRPGKTLKDYTSKTIAPQPMGMPAPCVGNGKHIIIEGGEYIPGAFDWGTNMAGWADPVTQSSSPPFKWPAYIAINECATYGGMHVCNPAFSSIDTVEDIGGWYYDSNGAQVTANSILPTILTGNDVVHENISIWMIYHADDLSDYPMTRTIEITWADGEVKQFDVIIPGFRNTVGWGNDFAGQVGTANYSTTGYAYHDLGARACATLPTFQIYHYSAYSQMNMPWGGAFTQNVFFSGGSSPAFSGLTSSGNDTGLHGMAITRIGQHHDDTGLWGEGFTPTDGSGNTYAHQDTWASGVFLIDAQAMGLPNAHEGSIFSTSTSQTVGAGASMKLLHSLQYDGSALTTSGNHHPDSIGSIMEADSQQHLEWIELWLGNQVVHSPAVDFLDGWSTFGVYEASTQQHYNASGFASSFPGNTAHDGGYWWGQLVPELLLGPKQGGGTSYNPVFYHDTTAWSGAGSADAGFSYQMLGRTNSPIFVHRQIYAKNIACSGCVSVPPATTPVEVCADINSTYYWQYTGLQCDGTPVPAPMMLDPSLFGPNGCVGCTYEQILNPSCTIGGGASPYNLNCECDKAGGQVPQISFTNINGPAVLGGGDGYADIEIDPGNSGIERWVYIIEPQANINAGLGIGAIAMLTLTNAGAGLTNGVHSFAYTSGSASGDFARIKCTIAGGVVTQIEHISHAGKNYISGEVLTFSGAGGTMTATISQVRGVTVSIQGTGTTFGTHFDNAHDGTGPNATFSNGLKATVGGEPGQNVILAHTGSILPTGNNYGTNADPHYLNVMVTPPSAMGLPFSRCDIFDHQAFHTNTLNGDPVTGLEAGDYGVYVIEGEVPQNATPGHIGCWTYRRLTIPPGVISTNGCTDNNAGTNDGPALNYDSNATVDDGSCIYCRAADGKIVDNTSTELTILGASSDGDIFTNVNSSTTTGATTSVSTDGGISYSRQLNSIFAYYVSLIVDANNLQNAEFRMEVWKRSSSAQTLTGATQVNATQINPTGAGFVYDFSDPNWTTGLTYGYYAIKSYVNDPDSGSPSYVEQEQCYQIDYFIVPVLACLIGPSGMQVGITTDGVTITDLNLVVPSIPGNNLNPCSAQCCDVPILTSYLVPDPGANGTPGCNLPAFDVEQTCPNGVQNYITSASHDIEFWDGSSWNVIISQAISTAGWVAATNTTNYNVNIYNTYGPGDYRVTVILDITFPNGATIICTEHSNVVSLNTDICGCTDPNALNYDPLAVIDDGSCTYCIDGCMDPNALNYNSLATCPDTCVYCVWGCMDAAATNYNPLATCPGPCNFGVGCGCTDITANNYGYDCAGNYVGSPPPCDDGCCDEPCAQPSIAMTTTDAGCGCVNNAGCNSNVIATGGPGLYTFNVDFGTDKGVAVVTFNTGHSNVITTPLKESVPDAMKITFDGTTTSEYSALVGGYMRGLVGSPGDACPTATIVNNIIHSNETCADGYVVADMPDIGNGPGVVNVYEFDMQTQTFVSTFATHQMTDYGATSTGDITCSIWPQAGAAIPYIGNTPNHPTTFNQTSHFNRNGVAYVSVPTSTTASMCEIVVEGPCNSTWWGVNLSCPALLTGLAGSSSSASWGSSNVTVDALTVDTQYYHIPIDEAGATNPNSFYWDGSGSGIGQQAGTLGKHDWIFEDPYGVTRLPEGCYKMESPVGSGTYWNVTVGVPTYVDDVNCDTAPAGPRVGGVVLMMEGPL